MLSNDKKTSPLGLYSIGIAALFLLGFFLLVDGDSAVLVIADGDTGYASRLYLSDGCLVEDYNEIDAPLDPEDAQTIGETGVFTVEEQAEGLLAETAKKGNVNRYTAYVENYMRKNTGLRDDAMFIPFISNHDMDRSAGYLTVASGHMGMAANLYLLGPGSPFIYYGEEIGLRGSRGGARTDANRRLAMLWGDGDTVKDPVGADYGSQSTYTVADLKGMSSSLLNHYKKLLMIRKANPEIARGTYTAVPLADTKAGGFKAEWEGSTVYVFHNTTVSKVRIDLNAVADPVPSVLAASVGNEDALLEAGILTLPAQCSAVVR